MEVGLSDPQNFCEELWLSNEALTTLEVVDIGFKYKGQDRGLLIHYRDIPLLKNNRPP